MKFLTKKMFLIVLSILIILYLSFSFYVASQVVRPGTPKLEIKPQEISNNFEDVTFKATDGLKISGWLFPSSPEKVVILVPGLNNTRTNLDYGAPSIAKELLALGYSILMYDPRGNGHSEGHKITFGLEESNDLVGAVNFAKTKGFKPEKIGVIGDSNGAVTELMALDRLKDVGAFVVDSGVTEFAPVIGAGLWREHNVPFFFDPAVFFFDKVFFSVDIWSIRPIDKVKNNPQRRLLFLHGEKDVVIPIRNSEELFATANKESEFVRFPNAVHVETYKKNPQLYREKVYGFLDKELGN